MKTPDERTTPFIWIDKRVISMLAKAIGPFGLAVYLGVCHSVGNHLEDYATMLGMHQKLVAQALTRLEHLDLVWIDTNGSVYPLDLS